jgi:phosphoenolpyruvate carboxylase
MFTRKTSRLFQTRLFHHSISHLPQNQISNIFKQYPQSMNLELKSNILLNYVEEAVETKMSINRMAIKDAHIPQHLSLAEKLNIAKNLRKKYYARPVLTSHPTEILSEESRLTINRIIQNIFKDNKDSKKQIHDDVQWIIQNSLLPKQNLRPEDEIDRQDCLYLDMMESWSEFNRKNIEEFSKNHHEKKEVIEGVLTQINKYAYSNVSSWAVADIDGNTKRSRQTMEHMEASLQIAIVSRYLQHLEPLKKHFPQLDSSYHYLQRCKKSIQDQIFFNLEGSDVAKKRLITELDKVIHALHIESEQKKALIHLRDLVDLVGFRGELKQFVRQSSKANKEAFNDLGRLLAKHHSEFEKLLEGGDYCDLSLAKKAQFHNYLRSQSVFFYTLKKHQKQLSKATIRELEILAFVQEYQDQFSYILSDTENYLSLNEVIILFGISSYFNRKLYIDEIRRPPVNLIPLCETPEDLENLPLILDDMLSNPYLKQVIIEKSEIVYVAGPSDLGKEGGVFAHINLIEAEKKAQDILKSHQAIDEKLKDVQVRVLYGLGGDFHRRISQASYQLFATFQGSEACKLGAFNQFETYVERVTGQASENSFRALELRLLENNHVAEYQSLQAIIKSCIQSYQKYMHHEASKALFRHLSIPHQLGILTNTSSRAESKSSAPKDILKSRAIGLANYDISSLFMTRIFMSADGLVDISNAQKQTYISLYQNSTTIQEIVQKILFAISVSDENRAWLTTVGYLPSPKTIEEWAKAFVTDETALPEHALAYTTSRLPAIIKSLSLFIPYPELIEQFWQTQTASTQNELALQLIEKIGQEDNQFANLAHEIKFDLLPRYQRLAKCIDDYRLQYSMATPEQQSIIEENFVLALRGDKKITAGPSCISALRNRFDKVVNPSLGIESIEVKPALR